MPYTTNVAGTTITAAYGNANIRDQVVTPFASASARTSAITSPVEGMVSWLSDVDRMDVYDGAAWQPNLGIIIWGNRASTSSTTTTETGVLRLDSIAMRASRAYRIMTSPIFLLSSVAGDIVAVRIRLSTSGSATTGSTLVAQIQAKTDSSQPTAESLGCIYQTTTAVTASIICTVGRSAGSGNASTFGAFDMWVEDMGPSQTDVGVDL